MMETPKNLAGRLTERIMLSIADDLKHSGESAEQGVLADIRTKHYNHAYSEVLEALIEAGLDEYPE